MDVRDIERIRNSSAGSCTNRRRCLTCESSGRHLGCSSLECSLLGDLRRSDAVCSLLFRGFSLCFGFLSLFASQLEFSKKFLRLGSCLTCRGFRGSCGLRLLSDADCRHPVCIFLLCCQFTLCCSICNLFVFHRLLCAECVHAHLLRRGVDQVERRPGGAQLQARPAGGQHEVLVPGGTQRH